MKFAYHPSMCDPSFYLELGKAAEEAGFAASEAALEDIPVRDDFQGERDFDVESDFDRSTQEGDSQHGDLDDEMCAEDSGAAGAPREDPLPVADEVEAAVAEAFAEESVDDVVRAGVSDDEAEDVFGDSDEPADEPGPPGPSEPWRNVSDPGMLGYCYYEGRSRLRVQVNKPPGRFNVQCYFHSSCAWWCPLAKAPPLEAVKKWLFEVEPRDDSLDKAANAERAQRHMRLARRLWA